MTCACCTQAIDCNDYLIPSSPDNSNNNTVTVEWSGGSDSDPMTMTLDSSPNDSGIADPVVTVTNGNGDEYRLGLFRWEWYGGIVEGYIGSWFSGCVPIPNNLNVPPTEYCKFYCTCTDLDTQDPCDELTTDHEYVLTGYVVTIFIPEDQNCAQPPQLGAEEFRGQMSIWKYTYIIVGGESSGEADVEEVLFTRSGVDESFIPCAQYTPVAPTVTLTFAP